MVTFVTIWHFQTAHLHARHFSVTLFLGADEELLANAYEGDGGVKERNKD